MNSYISIPFAIYRQIRSVSCGADKSHTMCLSDLGSNCGSDYIVSQGFTEAQKTEMLQIHNDLRAKVASGSANGLPTAGNLKRALIFWPRYPICKENKYEGQCAQSTV